MASRPHQLEHLFPKPTSIASPRTRVSLDGARTMCPSMRSSVYPELVIRDQEGRIDGVRYDELAPMLLNEVQKQQRKMAAQDEHSAAQDSEIRQLKQQLTYMHAALVKLQTKDDLVAQR